MAEILGATYGEIIDSLREDLLAALQENTRLTEENARLKAAVSDEEWLDNSVCESHDYRNRANRRQVDALIAARSKGGNDGGKG